MHATSRRSAAATAVVALVTLLLSLTGAPVTRAHAQDFQRFCPPMDRPTSHLKTYFSRPYTPDVSPVTQALVGIACAAAPNATIRVALFYLDYIGPDSEVLRLLNVLEYVHRTRHVSVNVVLEHQQFRSGDPAFIIPLNHLQRFAHVDFCERGCLSTRTPGAAPDDIQHMKFFLLDDTIWLSGADPVVFQSTANWSWTQLRKRQQSAVMMWDDPVLYREFATRWATMHTCAAWNRGCAGWNGQLSSRGLDPARYGIADHDGIWTDASPHPRPGSPGGGVRVWFAPWPTPDDPIARGLRATECTSGGEVRLGQLQVAADRPAVIDALSALQRQGCNVRILVSAAAWAPTINGLRALRTAGLDVGCVPGLHDKFITFNSRVSDPHSRRVVWAGSQNVYAGSLHTDDEEVLRISVADASGSAVADNTAAYNAYRAHWSHMATLRASCPSVATQAPSMREPLS